MTEKTRKLTTGAMFTAIFCVLMLINRQTGEAFAEIIYFLLPIPMVGYASKYGFRTGLTAMFAMTLLSSFLSTPTGIFYAFSESLIGLVLGSGIYLKKPTGRLLLLTMGLSVLVNILNILFMAALYGYTLSAEAAEMQKIFSQVLTQTGVTGEAAAAFEAVMNMRTLTQILIMATIVTGLMQGFVVFQLSLIILRRLKFTVPKPQPVFGFYPPQWSGYVGIVLYFGISYAQNGNLPGIWPDVVQLAGMAGYFYLLFFGCIAGILVVRKHVSTKPVVAVALVMLGFFLLPMVLMLLGFAYTNPSFHNSLMPQSPKGEETA